MRRGASGARFGRRAVLRKSSYVKPHVRIQQGVKSYTRHWVSVIFESFAKLDFSRLGAAASVQSEGLLLGGGLIAP